jgi:flagellar biosynthesis/type III secretory pathway protein FliH
MGLIKKDKIHDTGTLMIEKRSPVLSPKKAPVRAPSVRMPVAPADLPRAKTEAQRIVEEAVKESESIREQAREAGREEGRAESGTRIEEALATLNQAVKERKTILKDAEQEILRLAIKVAEQIIRSEVSMHRDVCLNIVAEAIARVSDREQIIVRVNREDAEYLKRYKDRLTGMLDGVKSFSILEDAGIEPGGCVIETNLGFVDAKIATKLDSIQEALKAASAEEER